MTQSKTINILQKQFDKAQDVINDLVKENYELKQLLKESIENRSHKNNEK